jgi:hypothetical protein
MTQIEAPETRTAWRDLADALREAPATPCADQPDRFVGAVIDRTAAADCVRCPILTACRAYGAAATVPGIYGGLVTVVWLGPNGRWRRRVEAP